MFAKLKIKILGVTYESVFMGAVECNTESGSWTGVINVPVDKLA